MEKPVSVQSHTSRCEITTHRVIWSIENFLTIIKNDELFDSQAVYNFDTDGVGSVKKLNWQLRLKKEETWIAVYLKLITSDELNISGTKIYTQTSLGTLRSSPVKQNTAPVDISDDDRLKDIKDLSRVCWPKCINLKKMKKKLVKGTLHFELDMKIFYKTSPSPEKTKTLTSCLEDFHRRSIPETADALVNASLKESIPFNEVKILTGDNQELQTRWGVLAARSPVFKANYLADMEERKTGIIKMPEMSGKAVEVLLHFMKKGELLPAWKDDDVIVELTNAAAMYELADLLKFLDETIEVIIFDLEGEDKPSLENIWKLLSLAHKLLLKNAEKALGEWIRKKSMGSTEDIFKAVSVWSELQKTES